MDHVVLFGQRVLGEGLDVMRPEVPLLVRWHVLSSHEVLVVPDWQQHRVFALAFAVVDGRLVLQLDFVLVVVVAHSFPDAALQHLLTDDPLLLLDPFVDVGHQQPGYLQRVQRRDLLYFGQVGKQDTRAHPHHLRLEKLTVQISPGLLLLVVPDVERIGVETFRNEIRFCQRGHVC